MKPVENIETNNSKKVLLFIVEGEADKIVLKLVSNILENNQIIFHIVRGDISSDWNVKISNVERKINHIIEQEKMKYMFKKSDILKVIHIFDMDGAYIADSLIKPSSSNDFVYNDDGIYCSNSDKVKSRNRHKRKVMDYLISLKTIANKYKYECYYFSCNLDHALYNIRNLADSQKTNMANIFANNFSKKEKLFVDYLESEVACDVPNTYDDSWEFIRDNNNSLQRHTNFNLFFKYIGIVLKYKKYYTIIKYSFEDNVYYGKIEGIDSLVNFESCYLSNIETEFHNAVDDYISYCNEIKTTIE